MPYGNLLDCAVGNLFGVYPSILNRFGCCTSNAAYPLLMLYLQNNHGDAMSLMYVFVCLYCHADYG